MSILSLLQKSQHTHMEFDNAKGIGVIPISRVLLDGRLIRWEFIVGDTFSLVLIRWVN